MHVLRRSLLVAPLLILAASGRLSAAPAQATWSPPAASSLTAAAPASSPGFVGQMLATGDPVVAAAGDIACDPTNTSFNAGAGTAANCRQRATSDLLVGAGLSAVLPLGDNQNYCGSLAAYQQAYDPSWGRVKSISHPAVGNHEYLTSGGGSRGTLGCNSSNAGAAGYFAYWGAAAGKAGQGYYSFDVGPNWHVVVLNTNCGDAGGCAETSPQGRWLKADLAANTRPCTLASFHIPLFSSGGRASPNARPFWNLLYAAHADVVLDGHDHIYERFAPQTPTGIADPAGGIREFIVGTGGENHTSIAAVAPNSQVRNTTTYGVLELALHPGSYDWQFVPEAGKTFTDSGTATCHRAGSSGGDTTAPDPPTGLVASAASSTRVDLTWVAAHDDVGVTAYRVLRDGVEVGRTTTATTFADTTVQPSAGYSYTVTALDAAGHESLPSNVATVTTPAAPPTSTQTFTPAADSYVSAAAPTANYGTQTQIRVDGSPVVRSYLRFSVSGLSGAVTRATLRIYANSAQSTGFGVSSVPDVSWGETTLTYANAPAIGAVRGASGAVTAGSWKAVDVTAAVTGNGAYGFALTTTSATALSLASREAGANAPQLVVTVG